MVIGVGIIVLRLHDCHSLKGKRKIVRSVVKQIRNHFNCSAAEVGANDLHQRAEIGFATISNSSRLVNSKIDKVFNMVDDLGLAEIIDTDMEIIHL
jgi:uncharacterized protein